MYVTIISNIIKIVNIFSVHNIGDYQRFVKFSDASPKFSRKE